MVHVSFAAVARLHRFIRHCLLLRSLLVQLYSASVKFDTHQLARSAVELDVKVLEPQRRLTRDLRGHKEGDRGGHLTARGGGDRDGE